jgi:membrane peptidoglycan carboxypeptidase
MQYVRTVTGRYERKLRRKLQEIVLSFLIDYHLSKIQILHAYLSVAYFGTGIWGLDSAKQQLFSKDPWDDLTLEESARLAAMLVYPKPRVPSANWEKKVTRRARYGLALHARLNKRLKEAAV